MEDTLLNEALVKYNKTQGKKTSSKELLFAELPIEKFKSTSLEGYKNIIDVLSQDDEVKNYLKTRYKNVRDNIE
jgi:hypothetical protein